MFDTTTTLLPHQEDAVAKLLPPRVGALYMDMGTGKSRTLIELARLRAGKFDRLFWITPCTLRDNVVTQLLEHTDIARERIALWDARTLRRQPDADIHVIGVETLGSSDRAVLWLASLVTDRSFVAVDESTVIKGDRAKRTQRVTNIAACARYRAILTGTPFSQGPVDLYSQMRFLSPKILGYGSWHAFARNHLVLEEKRDAYGRKRTTGRILSTHNEEHLAGRIAAYTYQVTKDECLTLPDKLYERRTTTLTSEQERAYEEAKREVLELDYDDWSPIAIYHLFSSLQSIVCGWWRLSDGTVVDLPHRRLDLLAATLAEIDPAEPVIVWAKYRRAAREIVERIGKRATLYTGDVSLGARPAALDRWREARGVLVATQATGGMGLTLNEAAYAVFYADGYKASERMQAEDRNHRIGQGRSPTYVTLGCSGTIDDRIAAALASKANALVAFRREVQKCRRDGLKRRARSLVRSL